jgi:type VI secretion system protein ImpK
VPLTGDTILMGAPARDNDAALVIPPQARAFNPNRLTDAAHGLLAQVAPLRALPFCPDVEALRLQLTRDVRAFETAARRAHVGHELIAAGRYALCTLLDETISATSWGGGGVWASRSLLVAFHNEASGGEKFFLVLRRLAQDPLANLAALELMYLCLALGMEGRYRLVARGHDQLAQLRERLAQLIADQHGAVETALSLNWRGAHAPILPHRRVLPLCLAGGAAVLLLGALFFVLEQRLARACDLVSASLLAIKAPVYAAVAAAAPPPMPVARPARLVELLAGDIGQGLLSVTESARQTTLTLHGDATFNSGSAELAPASMLLLSRIGAALERVPGKVLVLGHTDNVRPAPTARFASNAALSAARAAAVRDVLAGAGAASRYTVEGRADAEPLAPNDAPGNRARNRRVEISISTAVPDILDDNNP